MRVELPSLVFGGSESVMSEEQIAAEEDELVGLVSARYKGVAVEVVSVGFVSLEEVEGTDISAGSEVAG